jgi:hypothetical protein
MRAAIQVEKCKSSKNFDISVSYITLLQFVYIIDKF